jgi:hypothetical protein
MPTNYQLSLQITPDQIWLTDYQTDMALSANMTQQQMEALFATNPFSLTNPPARPGFILNQGFGLYSPQQAFRLFFQTDGNVALQCIADNTLAAQTGTTVPPSAGTWDTIWSIESKFNRTGAYFIMQEDGNLVLYNDGGQSQPPTPQSSWSSGTDGHPGSFLRMQDDGNLVIYDPNGNAIWSTGTNART